MISLGLVNTVKVKIILVVTKLGEVFQVEYSFSDKISDTIKATLSETYQMLQKNFQWEPIEYCMYNCLEA